MTVYQGEFIYPYVIVQDAPQGFKTACLRKLSSRKGFVQRTSAHTTRIVLECRPEEQALIEESMQAIMEQFDPPVTAIFTLAKPRVFLGECCPLNFLKLGSIGYLAHQDDGSGAATQLSSKITLASALAQTLKGTAIKVAARASISLGLTNAKALVQKGLPVGRPIPRLLIKSELFRGGLASTSIIELRPGIYMLTAQEIVALALTEPGFNCMPSPLDVFELMATEQLHKYRVFTDKDKVQVITYTSSEFPVEPVLLLKYQANL